MEMSEALKSLLWGAVTGLMLIGLLLIVGLNSSVLAQGRGAAGNRGGVPTPTAGRGTIVVPTDRRGPIVNLPAPDRRVIDIDRTRRDDIERRRRAEDDRRRRDERRNDQPRRRPDDDASRFQPYARWLGVDADRLEKAYLAANANNPDLRFSQFFSALLIAERANGSNPNVTPQAILRGLDSGMGLERTLVKLGLTAEEAKNAAKWAERIFNHLKP